MFTHDASSEDREEVVPRPKRKRSKFRKRIHLAGWPLLPYAVGAKTPLVSGFHGEDRRRATVEDIRTWLKRWPDANPGIVMPDNVIGLDVDGSSHGEGIDGLEALAEFERRFGDLPETGHIFHGRDSEGEPSPYGTRLYRIPDSLLALYRPRNVVGNLNKVTGVGGVDVIAPWIRYNAAPGAVHPSGEVYAFSTGDLPSPNDLPALTERQVKALLKRTEPEAVQSPGSKPLVAATPVLTGAARVADLLAQTRALAALREGETLLIEGEQRGWQRGNGFFVLACSLARAAEDRDTAKRDFVEAAETGGYDDAERQWDNALAAVEAEEEDHGRPYSTAVSIEPYRFAEEMLDRHFRDEAGLLTLRYNQGDQRFWLWHASESRFKPLSDEEIGAWVTRILLDARETGPDGEVRAVKMKPTVTETVVKALRGRTLISEYGAGNLLPASGGVPFRNGWLDIITKRFTPASPSRFITWTLPVDYEAEFFASPWRPEDTPLWAHYLRSIGFMTKSGELTDRGRLLRQMYGYALSGSNKHHKFFILHGVRRAGKGVSLQVLEELVGGIDVGAVTFDYETLAYAHGIAGMVGRRLILNDDLKFSDRNSVMPRRAVENFVKIASNGPVEANPKGKAAHSLRLNAVIVAATNDPPRWKGQASDAIPGRMIALEYTESFFGREDKTLNIRLREEYAGIVKFALDGWDELEAQDRFTEPAGMEDVVHAASIESSPVRAFACERLTLDSDETGALDRQAVYNAYADWSVMNGYQRPLDKPTFDGDLDSVLRDLGAKKAPRRVGGRNSTSRKVWIGVRLLTEKEMRQR